MSKIDKREDMPVAAWQAVAVFNKSARADVAAVAEAIDLKLFQPGHTVTIINGMSAFLAVVKQRAQTIDGASRTLLETLNGIADQMPAASVPKKLDEIRTALSMFVQ